eukprot:4704886-Amphidinium_carterae.1
MLAFTSMFSSLVHFDVQLTGSHHAAHVYNLACRRAAVIRRIQGASDGHPSVAVPLCKVWGLSVFTHCLAPWFYLLSDAQ